MFDHLEDVLKAHQFTVAALSVLGTFSAVAVSLVVALLSQRTNRTQVKAFAAIRIIMHSTLEGRDVVPTYVVVSILNTGIMEAAIPFTFFRWRVPFRRGYWFVTPMDYSREDEWVPQRTYPVEIKPRKPEVLFLHEIKGFDSQMTNILRELNWLQRRWLKASIITDDYRTFDVKLDRSLRDRIETLRLATI